ncbi:MAG TPA: hypothetical protein VEI02_16140, partial [Planctomycetota bacterium]|nr:hypothetical protein [Planctomycetota bacterium]
MKTTDGVRRIVAAALVGAAAGCGGGDRGRTSMQLSLVGLAPLGPQQGNYEGFAVGSDGVVRSTGKFDIDASTSPARVTSPDGLFVYGTVDAATFGPANTHLGQDFPFIWDATAFFVTIEPEGDADLVPSGNVVLGGAFVGNEANLTVAGLTATGGPGLADFSTAGGTAVRTTPTDGPGGDLTKGLWFASTPGGAPTLSLPALSGSSVYEAFVTNDGMTFVSLGRFRDPAAPDFDAASFPGRAASGIGFAAPGQDFLTPFSIPRPSPLDLGDGTRRLEITVEPFPDNSLDAFPLPLMRRTPPASALSSAGAAAADVAFDEFPTRPAYTLTPSAGAATLTATAGALGALGPTERDGVYELWAVAGAGAPQSAGRFRVDPLTANVVSADGSLTFGTTASFVLDASALGGGSYPDAVAATEWFLTVEPPGDPVPAPSASVLLAGAAGGGTTALTVAGLTATGGRGLADFAGIGGSFILRTPTDDAPGVAINDRFGAWFRSFDDPDPSLTLPPLPAGWKYEAWAVENATGARASLGAFDDPSGPDDDAATWPGRGSVSVGFPVPGQDFLNPVAPFAAPALDLTGYTVIVTVEPNPDVSPAPSAYRVLEAPIPAATEVPFPLANVFVG